MRLFLIVTVLVLSVAGCRPIWDPTFMPSGYKHHQGDFKSPPGPDAKPIGYEYSYAKNEYNVEEWRKAAADLILRAEASGQINMNAPLHLQTDLSEGVFKSTLDSVLREELLDAGYTFAQPDQAGVDIFYSAYDPSLMNNKEYTTGRPLNDDVEHPHETGEFWPKEGSVRLVLGGLENGLMAQHVSAIYNLPLHGYRPHGYVPPHEDPVIPEMPEGYEAAEESLVNGYNH